LMVKGIFSGMWTLLWAMILLFVFNYIMSLCMVAIVAVTPQRNDAFEADARPLFRSVEMSIMTVYRCVTGDCTTASGAPLLVLLLDEYGALFATPWILYMIVVTFGLFNLISAIYIENTLSVAKQKNESRDALWVAKLTKRLLTKFCGAQETVNQGTILSGRNTRTVLMRTSLHNLQNTDLQISKDTFLHVIADSEVQTMMDDLDTPSERERLFDVFDADNSGTLSIRELVQGLLRVRGDAQRSDVVEASLAVRAVFDLARAIQADVKATRDMLSSELVMHPNTVESQHQDVLLEMSETLDAHEKNTLSPYPTTTL